MRQHNNSRILRDVRFSIACGIALATLYSLWVTTVVGATRTASEYQLGLGVIIGTYYAAGIIGGGVVGLMLPMTGRLPGRILVGVVAAVVVFTCIESAMHGPFVRWKAETWQDVLLLGTFFGVVSGVFWRRVTGK